MTRDQQPVNTGQNSQCETCGKTFYVFRSRIGKKKFCSIECKRDGYLGKTTITSTTQAEARVRGERFYFTGKPCAKGHLSRRYASCCRCFKCAKAEEAKLRTASSERRAARPLSVRERAKLNGDIRYTSGKICPRGHHSDRLVVNSACVECSREDRIKREAEDSRTRERRIAYRKENAERYKAHTRNRRAKAKDSEGEHSQQDVADMIKQQKGKCAYCKKKLSSGYHVDHIHPLSKGGRNDRSNLQITCKPCNLRKHNKEPEDFARLLGMLI